MDNFIYHNYTKIVFGKDQETNVGALTAELGKKVLLHYGGGSIKQSGLYARVVSSLQEAGVAFVELGGALPNPRLSLVRAGIDLCRREGVDAILAVGGGSAIDSAKAIALGVPFEGDIWDLFTKKATSNHVLPVGVVLTIPAAGSESSIVSVVTNEETQTKIGLHHPNFRPQFAILNPELCFTLPPDQIANGVCDMLAHVMERYFTNTPGVDFSDRLCEGAMRSMLALGPKVLENPTDYDTWANLMWAGCVAHGDILGVGRVGDWASHRTGHHFSAYYDLPHGTALSILFPAWIKYVYRENLPLFVQWAQRVFDVDLTTADPDAIVLEGVRRLEAFYKRIGLATRFSEVGIDDTHFEAFATRSIPVGALKALSVEDIVAIYRLAL
ncbi:MAG: iron-containing alcohol dehydrogenase [Oscillospiraceae bacterium]|nr:iron-containing alcohol dehydrogenase [Oscillospiraceae bacterium]